ncbi:MAG TPA: TOBE domain-containing protein [Gammaproteobacteria bacterium]|nr:TOBE domain-containing protein [Gammaproteobacteria bacterium]
MSEKSDFGLQGQIWITAGDESMGGHGRIHLLSKIAELGSISQAAKSMKMSYKAAWDAVNHMNNLAGEPLLHRTTGGKGGGSTTLTERGQQLISNFQRIEEVHQRFLQELSQDTGNIIDDLFVLKRLSMKTSARNQFFGKVKSIQLGATNDAVEIAIAGGQTVVATVTSESTKELGLEVGSEVFALIKASSIILVSEAEDMRFSARNQFAGTVARVQKGAVNSEVVVTVGDSTMAVIITNDSAERLALKEGSAVTAIFKASSVIVGCPL